MLSYLPDVQSGASPCCQQSAQVHRQVCVRSAWVSMHPHSVCLTLKLQNDPCEKLLYQRTMHPSAPPRRSWTACVWMSAAYSMCMCLCVCVSLLDHFLWLWRWTGSGKECFFFPPLPDNSWEWWTWRMYSNILFFLTAVGAFWKEKEFEPGYWERRLHCVTSVAN